MVDLDYLVHRSGAKLIGFGATSVPGAYLRKGRTASDLLRCSRSDKCHGLVQRDSLLRKVGSISG